MFPNLRAEMARKNIGLKKAAHQLGLSPKTLSNKMAGKSEFTLSEVEKIRNSFFPGAPIEYLFNQQEVASNGHQQNCGE